MDKLFWIALVFAGGSMMPVQGAYNARLGAAGGSAFVASLISFTVGMAGLAAYVLLTRPVVSWAGLAGAPWYAWLGGLSGAFSITAIILAFPRLGPGLSFGLFVAGQLIISVLLEHFNVLVAHPHPISALRVVGIALVLAGVTLIRAF